MGYGKKEHRHARQVKVLLNDEEFIRLREYAHSVGTQHSPLSRAILKAVIEVIEQTGELPDWIKDKLA
ncbi:hypothetical protein [Pseudomonas sp. NA-150]|uniref:hypothetical protein n=1 Tax=Pseudomonas sp. NA-150 TaxID=3367525 RepID=UPI0037C6797E